MNSLETNCQKAPRSAAVERVLWIVLLLNMAVAAAKFFFGLASGSTSMRADGIHSFFDGFGNVVGIIALSVASRPADKSHPYGHAKFETYGSLAIGVLLLAAAFEVGSSAVGKLVSGVYTADVTWLSFVVMVGTMAVNIGVTCYERHCGKKYRSDILLADASHTLSDAFVSLGVIAGLVLVQLGFPAADPVMALVVTAAILVTAVGVFRTALRTLSDHARIPSRDISAIASSIPGVCNVHQVRTRGTQGEVYCDLHIQVEPEMTVFHAHGLADQVEDALKRQFPAITEVLVHIEPLGDEGADEKPIVGDK